MGSWTWGGAGKSSDPPSCLKASSVADQAVTVATPPLHVRTSLERDFKEVQFGENQSRNFQLPGFPQGRVLSILVSPPPPPPIPAIVISTVLVLCRGPSPEFTSLHCSFRQDPPQSPSCWEVSSVPSLCKVLSGEDDRTPEQSSCHQVGALSPSVLFSQFSPII
ncbi:NDP-hexose 4-ketoreductase [Platysternon megacephalum]|uniref:NDP-hexose 4-ketoreductase n=1 Tax=Platysternon megacephalum TaxID=55544 RepID=A0A4D9DFP6_9SAUR|nr:NDP-hexose 4-ketoreductase [Platysternon megacephalum]